MSKATNSTVEVEIPGFKGAVVVPVMVNGEKVGHITQVQNEIYAGVAGYRVTVGETQGVFFKTARAAKAAAEEMAIAHCVQAETVEVEESAQADETEIVYSVDFLGFDLDGREFRVSEYGTARAAHAAAKEFARSRADYGDQVRFEAFHGNGNSKIQTIYFNGFASGYIEKTVQLTEEADTARLLALLGLDEEELAQVETAEAEEPAHAMANEDGESVSLECPACDRVVATVTPANVGPSSYTRTCKCGRRTRHDVTLTITQDDRVRVARWGMVATNVGTLKRHWVQTDRGMKWGKVFVPAEVHA